MDDTRTTVLRCGKLFDGHRLWTRDAGAGCVLVVLRGKRITQVGWEDELEQAIEVPKSSWVDLSAFTLMPGLIDCHVHPLINEKNYKMQYLCQSSAFKALRGLAAVQSQLRCGWTSLRVAGDADMFYAAHDLRRAIDEGLHVGPRMTGAGHYLSITGGGGDINTLAPEVACHVRSDGKIVDGPEEMRKAVREEIKFGSDWIKLMVTGTFTSMSTSGANDPTRVHFSPEELRVAVEETRRLGKHVMVHAHSTDGIKQALQAGVRSIEHASFIDDEGIELMLQREAWLVPTQFIRVYFGSSSSSSSDLEELKKRMNEQSLVCLRKAVAAGVKIACGSDYCGWDATLNVRELEYMCSLMGMTPEHALRSATSIGADLLGWSDRVGAVEAGKLADLIVVEGDPTSDITALRQVRAVILDGKVVHSLLPVLPAMKQ